MWRCLIIYRSTTGCFCLYGHRIPLWSLVMIFPSGLPAMGLILCCNLVAGTILIIQVLDSSKLPPILVSAPWIVIWGAIAVASSWTLTGLIIGRIIAFCYGARKTTGSKRYCLKYIGIVAMLFESAALTSSFASYFMVALLAKFPSLAMMPFLLTQIQVSTTPQMIEHGDLIHHLQVTSP